MDERIIQFISALRSAGVRISLAESKDAFEAVDLMGISNRDAFRLSLRATLVKDASGIPTFEELFPLFFGSGEVPPMMNISEDLSPQEAEMLADALKQLSQRLRDLLDRLIHGEQLSQRELDQLGRLVGLQNADDLRYRDWMSRRMQQALGFSKVREALQELMEMLEEMGMDGQRLQELRQLIQSNQQAMGEQIRQYAGEKIADNMSQMPPDDPLDQLLNRPFNALSDREMDRLRKEVQRLAALLRSRVALRQKHAKSGQLDPKATIRANLKHNSVPIVLKHRDHHLKPKFVVICDISTSMRYCSELMMSLVYSLQDQVSKTHSFAFINHLEYISPEFSGKPSNDAVRGVLDRLPPGYYNTDLGYSLENFVRNYLDYVDSRTTFIMVGDGRNNYNDPRLDIFSMLTRRAKNTIWLNPEPPHLWGTGDSDMLKYAPLCDAILQVRNLAELTSAIDRLFI
jgi:uncharacterized protein with von Willebrand factor type A (vWA) domain